MDSLFSRAGMILLASFIILAGGDSLPVAGQTIQGGTIEGDVTWTREAGPHRITADVVVPVGSTLRLEPGVEVRVAPNVEDQEGHNFMDLEILVEGRLIVAGTETDTVVFTSDGTNPRWMDWQGIVGRGKEAELELSHALIEYATEGVRLMRGRIQATDVVVRNCHQYGFYINGGSGTLDRVLVTEVGNPAGTSAGAYLDRGARISVLNSVLVGVQNGLICTGGSGVRFVNTVFSLSSRSGLTLHNSSPEVTGCSITGNDYGLIVSAGGNPTVRDNNIFQNTTANVWVGSYSGEPMELDLSGNWWGTQDLVSIEELILDGLDDSQVQAFVVIEPFLEEAVTTGKGDR